MKSEIKWQTGVPKEIGMYLVTLSSGEVTTDIWLGRDHSWYECEQIIAWCKLSDVEPYKA